MKRNIKFFTGYTYRGWRKDFCKEKVTFGGSVKPVFTQIFIPEIVTDELLKGKTLPKKYVRVKVIIEESPFRGE